MELKEFLKVLKKHLRLIAAFTALGLIGGLGFYLTRPKPMFESKALLFITRAAQPESESYYTYDGFHAQQTAYHYADTVIGLARSLGANNALRKSEQLIEISNLSHINKPLQIATEAADQSMQRIVDSIIDTATRLNEKGDKEISIQLVNDKITVRETKQNPFLILAVGVGIGIGIGIFIACLKNYLRN